MKKPEFDNYINDLINDSDFDVDSYSKEAKNIDKIMQRTKSLHRSELIEIKRKEFQQLCQDTILGKYKVALTTPGHLYSIFTQTEYNDAGVNIELDNDGNTALHYILNPSLAIKNSKAESAERIKQFLSYPAIIEEVLCLQIDINKKNNNGLTAIDSATERDLVDILPHYYTIKS